MVEEEHKEDVEKDNKEEEKEKRKNAKKKKEDEEHAKALKVGEGSSLHTVLHFIPILQNTINVFIFF